MKITNMICLLSVIVLNACTPKPTYQMNDVERQLKKSALSVEDSLRTLALTQQVYAKEPINTDILVTPQGGMGGITNIDWAGPIEPLLEKIGTLTHYRVKVLGPLPAVPVIITLTARDRVIADIIKDAGIQAGKRANLVVYPTSRVIELRYIPT
ncbi:type IVB secretion system lipoprotein DotD [Candidatus Berkiella cookevillensis]|uniref:Type IVB secretion system lipoprotein DotD n=1 Tax=Candidatus Berkiella cookevillensis TaxID=437022 RepID=A0A0Q9YHQ1_9GAMM|nr:type IVB secretion system lipoprotein DotD [Candidatus Berkiella cookevillensis]MCS5708326.1 type IVB secretion system lipoprotein DotD [Candidatus Berkiella cookevillensis]